MTSRLSEATHHGGSALLIDAIQTLLLTTVLLLCSTLAMAAAQPIDSLDWNTLRGLEVEEIHSANAEFESPRYRIMLALMDVDRDVAEATLQLNKALSSAKPDSDEAHLAEMMQCSFAELLGNSISFSQCAERGKSIARISQPWPAALAQLHHGIWLATNGRYEGAFKANRSAEELALAAGDTRLAAIAQNNQGVDYLIRGLPVQALKKFRAALEHVRNPNIARQQSLLTMLSSNIASAHLEIGDFESANALLQTSIHSEHYDRNNPTNLIDEVILARATLALGRPQESYVRLSEVLKAIGSLGVTGVQAYAHSVIGELQIALGNTEKGIESFKLAQEYAQRSGDPLRVNKVDVYFADALVGLERYTEANVIIEASIDALGKREPSMILARALDLRGDFLKATGQRTAANAAKRQARQMQIKVAGAEYDMDLAMLEKSLELANKANELTQAQQKARQSEARAKRDITLRNQLILIALLLAFITYLGLSRRYERKVAKTIQTANAELGAKVSERTIALEQEMAQRLDAQSERQSLAQSLAESEKLQALGQLTSGVAHDFNNLMTVVTLSAGMLRDTDQKDKSSSVRHVDNILAAAESASGITASLLAYARKQPLAPQPTNLDSFIVDSLPLFESTLSQGMSLEVNTEPCPILVDRGQLTTAIINLLLNAKEALHERGNVTLQVSELVQIDEQGESQDWATISVTDHGQGMTPTELRRATEPFYTTKAVGHGTGLGLSMVDGFAKQSGGFLQMNSIKGKRTVVTLYIPRYTATALIDGATEIKVQDTLTEGLVMIVDDQRAIRDVLCRLLEKMGLETLSASSGDEALRKLEGSQLPNLLITDLMMPGEMNGQQLAAEVRKRYVDLPVLIMSGYTDSVELDVEFLHKPFSIDDLHEAITRAMVQKRSA